MASNEEIYVDGIPISDLRVVDLKEQLEKRGCSKSGSKTVLVKRLKDALAMEKMQEAQLGKDPAAAPNMEMKACGNDFVAEYLEKQQQMLQAAKVAQARSAAASGDSSASSTGASTPGTPDVDNRLGSPPASTKRSRSTRTKSPRKSTATEEIHAGGDGNGAFPAPSSATSAPNYATLATGGSGEEVTTEPLPTVEVTKTVVETVTAPSVAVAVGSAKEEMDTSAEKLQEQPEVIVNDAPAATTDTKPADVTVESPMEPATSIVAPIEEVPLVQPVAAMTEMNLSLDQRSMSPDKLEAVPLNTTHDQSMESEQHQSENEEEQEMLPSPASSVEEDDHQHHHRRRRSGDDRNRNDDTATVDATSQDDADEVEMEISVPINAADELFEAINTAIPSSTSSKVLDSSQEDVSPSTFEIDRDIPQRKRKWVASTRTKRAPLSISSDSLKEIVGSVKESVLEEERKTKLDDILEAPPPKRIVITRDVGDDAKSDSASEQLERRVEVEVAREPAKTTEDGFVRVQSPSPARHPPSNIIHVRGLVRPFTVGQLLELLSKYGNLQKEEFWIDQIKSHCIVKYDDESSATLARDRLHNIQWPSSNTKMLRVDFATQEDLDRHRTEEAPAARVSRQNTEGEKERQSASDRPIREVREVRKSEHGDHGRSSVSPKRGEISRERDRSWDRGKKRGESPPTDPRGAGGLRRSQSPDRRGGDQKRDQPAQPAKLLDELFRKTKATPCIYWLPLSEEQIREKEKERKKRIQERFERVRKMEEEERERERRREGYPRQSPSDYRNRRR